MNKELPNITDKIDMQEYTLPSADKLELYARGYNTGLSNGIIIGSICGLILGVFVGIVFWLIFGQH